MVPIAAAVFCHIFTAQPLQRGLLYEADGQAFFSRGQHNCRAMKRLLLTTGLLESATGLALLIAPAIPVFVLLGVSLDAPAALTVTRVAGTALLALGWTCWLARRDVQSRAARGLIRAMLLYNLAVAAVLAHANLGLGLSGAGLWLVVAVHAALAAWCIACLWNESPNAATTRSPSIAP